MGMENWVFADQCGCNPSHSFPQLVLEFFPNGHGKFLSEIVWAN